MSYRVFIWEDHFCFDRELVTCESESLMCQLSRNTCDLKKHMTRTRRCDIELHSSLSSSHRNLKRLLGIWFVGKHTNPHFSSSLECSGDDFTCSLDLAWIDKPMSGRFQSKLTKRERSSSRSLTFEDSSMHFSVSCLFWLQHSKNYESHLYTHTFKPMTPYVVCASSMT